MNYLKDILAPVLPKGKFWTQAWSLVEGCTPVSPGCKHCWLAAMARRFLPSQYTWAQEGGFKGYVRPREDRLDMPLHKRKPQLFAIWSDLFHESVSPEFIGYAFMIMALSGARAKGHKFIIVTKRPQRAADYLSGPPQMWQNIMSNYAEKRFGEPNDCHVHNAIAGNLGAGHNVGWPLNNVIILVTMEDQQRADERAPYAMQLAAQGWNVGALCEPLLGPVDLSRIYSEGILEGGATWGSWDSALDGRSPDIWGDGPDIEGGPRLSWIITGGESGHGARPCHPDWVRSLRDQAQEAGIPFLFKQWGSKGFDPKGRTLDGREWLEVPET